MSTGIAVGLKKGFPVTKREKIARPSSNKGVSGCLCSRLLIYIQLFFAHRKSPREQS